MKLEDVETKEDAIEFASEPLVKPMSWVGIISLFGFILTPFICIWGDWQFGWKFGASSLLGMVISYISIKTARAVSEEMIGDKFKDEFK